MISKKILLITAILFLLSYLTAEDLILDIMFSNDIHGGIDRYPATFMNPEFPPMLGGGAVAATYIKEVREKSGEQRDNLLIDVGDFFQGHPIGTVSKGVSVMEYMNKIGYDLTVVGNHEYDIGEDELIKTYEHSKIPILACNIINKKTGKLVDYVQPYLMVEKMGVKIGIIGVTTTDTEMMSFPEHIKNIDFTPVKPAVEKYIKIVKDEGADIVIVAGHMGLPYTPQPTYDYRYGDKKREREYRWGLDSQELAHEVDGIDLIIGGHMHKGFDEPWEDPVTHTLCIQGYAYGSSLGHILIKIDKETKQLSGWEAPTEKGILVTLFEDQIIPDKDMYGFIEERRKKAEKGMDEVIGETSVFLSKSGTGAQSVIGNFIVDVMREATNADFSFLNLGGIRDEIDLGPITYREVFNVQPFDNQLVVFKASGEFLKRIIEKRVEGSRHGLRVSGVNVVYNRKRKNFDRVTKLLIGGEPWDKDKIYTIVTTDFLMQGNAGLTLLTQVPEEDITRLENNMRDVIADYIRKNSPVKARIDDRWKKDDNSEMDPQLIKELNK